MTATTTRVRERTPSRTNLRIEQETVASIAETLRDDRIEERLQELDREWDIERVLQTNFAAVTLAGIGLSLLDRRWLALPAVAAGFMVQHSLQGWCPPMPLFRKLGFRAQGEIERERMALRALRDAPRPPP